MIKGGIIPGHMLKELDIITPFVEKENFYSNNFPAMTYGASAASYDVRLGKPTIVHPNCATLAVTLEEFNMPDWVAARVANKSTWMRLGLRVEHTVIDPGWRGYLTLELSRTHRNHENPEIWELPRGMPIAQIIFEALAEPTKQPYNGKYQNQPDIPVEAR
jgi:dCTP deaminase